MSAAGRTKQAQQAEQPEGLLLPPRQASGGARPVSPTARDIVRRLRFPLALAAFILVVGVAVVFFQPHAGPRYLDTGDAGPFGARALAQILAHRGQRVVRVTTPQQAARSAGSNTTIVVTGPAYLDGSELATLSRLPGDRMLVEPDGPALRALAPGIRSTGIVPADVKEPECGLAAATLAGDAEMGGVILRTTARGAQVCYPELTGDTLIRYASGGRTITVLGTGTPLTNEHLADRGDAALALNLLAGDPAVIWLTPGPAAVATGSGGRQSIIALIPVAADLIVIQLLVVAAAAALWRSRRLGPLVTEPLPVVVRAAETVEGHGRLYRSRRSRDRAAEALRAGTAGRLAARLGLHPAADPATITAAVAARSRRDAQNVHDVLFGPVPGTDQALVQLATRLDDLEREVRTT
ncbi:MAG: DUF4350 domain-containing protein [Micromonosporaceae bacterium]